MIQHLNLNIDANFFFRFSVNNRLHFIKLLKVTLNNVLNLFILTFQNRHNQKQVSPGKNKVKWEWD